MAVAYLDRGIVSRGKGQSAIAKAAYNSCSRLTANDGLKDFTRKSGLAYQAIIAASPYPSLDRATLWTSIEAQEKRKDAQLAYSYQIALPCELNQQQNIALAQDFTQHIIARYSLAAADLCVHYPTKRKGHADPDKQNPHLHLLTPTRDADGKKVNLYGKKDDLVEIRTLWQKLTNIHLKAAGCEARIDMRKAEEQIAELDADIANLRKRADKQTQELAATQAALEQKHARTAETHAGRPPESTQPLAQPVRGNRNASTPKSGSRPETSPPAAQSGLPDSDENAGGRAGPAGHAARQGRSTRHPRAAGGRRRTVFTSRKAGPEPSLHTQTLTATARRVAKRIERLRWQRQAHAMTNPLSTLANRIASRIDGARYERQRKHTQAQDTQRIRQQTR